MWKLVRRYYGELCDREQTTDKEVYDEEVVFENTMVAIVQKEFQKYLKNDLEANYVIDDEVKRINYEMGNKVRLFYGEQENWNNYIEMYVVKDNTIEELLLQKEVKNIADNYDNMSFSNFAGSIRALEDKFEVHYQKIYNMIAEEVIKNRLNNFKGSKTINNKSYMDLIKQCEKEFSCEIDFIDYSISPNLF